VNETSLATVRLDPSNERTTEAVIAIPPEILADYNHLVLTASQHYTLDCEDPFSPSLWTRVAASSSLVFRYLPQPLDLDLGTFPVPFFDPLRYGPVRLDFVLPESPCPETLEALGVMAAALGQAASYHPVQVRAVNSIGDAPTIVVGTQHEQPILALLPGMLDVLSADGGATGLVPGIGFVRVLRATDRADTPVLVVSGGDGAGVLLAARALGQADARALLSGQTGRIDAVTSAAAMEAEAWPGFIPKATEFTLEDLGAGDATARGVQSMPIVVDLRRTPSMQLVDGELEMTLRYSYGAQLDTRLSSLEVRLDDVAIRSIPLDDVNGGTNLRATFPIPDRRLLNEHSRLQVIFHLFPRDYDPCRRMSDQQIWGTLHRDSSFSLPRDYYAELPDLSALRNGGYPFTRHQDLSGAAILLPDAPNAAELAVMLAAATRLGRLTKAQSVALKTVTVASLDVVRTRDLVAIGTRERNPLVAQLASDRGTFVGLLEPVARSGGRRAAVEEVLATWDDQICVLMLTGFDDDSLRLCSTALLDDRLFAELAGNLVVVNEAQGQPVARAMSTAPTSLVGRLPWHRQPSVWLRRNWVLLVALGLVGAAVLYFLIRILLLQYRGRRRREEQGLPA
jgi:hypothetical protein